MPRPHLNRGRTRSIGGYDSPEKLEPLSCDDEPLEHVVVTKRISVIDPYTGERRTLTTPVKVYLSPRMPTSVENES